MGHPFLRLSAHVLGLVGCVTAAQDQVLSKSLCLQRLVQIVNDVIRRNEEIVDVIFEVVGRNLVRRSRVLKPLKFALSFVEHVLGRAKIKEAHSSNPSMRW